MQICFDKLQQHLWMTIKADGDDGQCTLLSAAGLGGGGLWGGTLPLNDPIDDVPDCRASLLRRVSTGEVPVLFAGTELSTDDLQEALKQ